MAIVLFFYLLDCAAGRAQGPQHPVLEVAAGVGHARWLLSKLLTAARGHAGVRAAGQLGTAGAVRRRLVAAFQRHDSRRRAHGLGWRRPGSRCRSVRAGCCCPPSLWYLPLAGLPAWWCPSGRARTPSSGRCCRRWRIAADRRPDHPVAPLRPTSSAGASAGIARSWTRPSSRQSPNSGTVGCGRFVDVARHAVTAVYHASADLVSRRHLSRRGR